MEKEEVLKVYRHSLAHVMAKAVIELYGKEVCIFKRSCKIGLEIVLVYPFASLEILGCMTDRVAVLYNVLAFLLV